MNLPSSTVGPPPDGGWVAWSQVLGGHLVVFLCWGYINTFGLFQTYYTTESSISASTSDVAWIGSMLIFLLMFIGVWSGSASDSGYFRLTTLLGSFMFVFGVFMTSICTKFWQLILAHGICTGLGNGLLFVPTISVVATYFSPRRKSLAIGTALTGTSVGGLIIPVMFNNLLPKIGFGWSMRAFGLLALVLSAISQCLLRQRLPPKQAKRILEFEALRDGLFVLFVIGAFMNFLGLYFALTFVGAYARNVLGLSFSRSINVLLVINGTGVPGRLILMWLADQRQIRGIRPVTVYIPVSLVTSLLFFVWIGVHDLRGLYIFAAFYGFFGGGLQSLYNASLTDMALDPTKIGAQVGWGFTIDSFSMLIGNPIAGVLVQADNGRYLYAQLFAGACTMAGFIITSEIG
ncbi:MFS general substrate transporter [Rhizodiscina lignyota]|uniref:MFS general substrate transporter n=1 Tax=Rhizodiscina lignyota TaxID=1504668 RepID=A0A9P4I6R6_9PEZI|nr:MFS general substrate transporter [Rhizodiscina lignyota]